MAQPDVCYLGGLSRTLKVVEMAKKAGLPVTPHAANMSMVTVFTLHMMGAISNAGPYVEFSIEGNDYYPWQEDFYRPALLSAMARCKFRKARAGAWTSIRNGSTRPSTRSRNFSSSRHARHREPFAPVRRFMKASE